MEKMVGLPSSKSGRNQDAQRQIISNKLSAKHFSSQEIHARVAVLNKFTE